MSLPVDSYKYFFVGKRFNLGSGTATRLVLYDAPIISLDGSDLCPYMANGQVRKLVSIISGLTHLEGQLVSITQDGAVSADIFQKVISGGITLSVPAAVVHVGLPYVGTMQMLPLGGDGQTVNETKKRKVYDVVLRLWQSFSGKFGKDLESLFPLVENKNIPEIPLFTGDYHYTPFESSWDDNWQPVLVQDDPLPFMLLAMVIRSEIEEDK